VKGGVLVKMLTKFTRLVEAWMMVETDEPETVSRNAPAAPMGNDPKAGGTISTTNPLPPADAPLKLTNVKADGLFGLVEICE
jgi:hypothetical protein